MKHYCQDGGRRAMAMACAIPCLLLALGWPVPAAVPAHHARDAGTIEFDEKSDYSHIRVRRRGDVRTMIFVHDSGGEAIQSIVNLQRPHELLVPYTRCMFITYLFRPKPQQVLIAGLGGGAMVHFLARYDPQLRIDAVEIDPAVVKAAADYFAVRSGGRINVATADAVKYLEETKTRYDAIYMDAFLKPSADTDSTGAPLRMKTIRFYRGVRQRLHPDGVIAFNLNPHKGIDEDLGAIREVFPQVYVFRVSGTNVVAVATQAAKRATTAELKAAPREIDRRFQAGFSFQQLLGNLAH
jgi:spermidine synthase